MLYTCIVDIYLDCHLINPYLIRCSNSIDVCSQPIDLLVIAVRSTRIWAIYLDKGINRAHSAL